MKKILSLFLALCLFCGVVPGFAAVPAGGEQDAVALLRELNIMKGDADGNLRLDDTVSRAEFTKVAVACSTFHNFVATHVAVSPFKDVLHTHWAAPYIQLAVANKLCKGYPDASFRPDDEVAFEEAVTMMLKVLGYTDSDFGASWPYGQVGMANQLEMTKYMTAQVGTPLTRREVARLAYNTLNTKMKSTGAPTQKLLTTFDCTILEDATIIATTNEDSSLGANKVFTTAGMLEFAQPFPADYVGRQGDLVVKNGDDFVAFLPKEQTSSRYTVTTVIGSDLVLNDQVLNLNENLKTYYKCQTMTYGTVSAVAEEGDTFVTFAGPTGVVDYGMLIPTHESGADIATDLLQKYVIYSQLQNAVVGYQNGTFHQIDVKDSTVCYKNKIKTTYMAVKNDLSMGDLLYVKKDNAGVIEYVSYEKGNIQGPYTVQSADWSTRFALDDGTAVMRGGVKTTQAGIQINDVIYYSKDLNMVLAYFNKITGVYENALPNRDMPTSVVISGTTYAIESVAAFDKLSSNGSFGYGDTVTLLLGKTNQVADVLTPNGATGEMCGYVTWVGTKEVADSTAQTHTAPYAMVALPDGSVQQYTTDRNYQSLLSTVVKVSFSGGVAKLTREAPRSDIRGTVSSSSRTIGKTSFADTVAILDVTTPVTDKAGSYARVYPARLDGIALDSSRVLYAKKDQTGQITQLILNDVTGDAYTYGVVTSFVDQSTQYAKAGVYKYNIGKGVQVDVHTGGLFGVQSGQPAKFVFSPTGAADSIQPLINGGAISKLTATSLTVGSKEYVVSDKVKVFVQDSGYDYNILPLSQLIADKEAYNATAYYDKPAASGGAIRVILVTKR